MGRAFVTDGQWRKTLAVVRSLGKKGIEVTVGENTRLATSLFSKYATKRVVYPSPGTKPDALIDYLLDELKQVSYDVFFPMEEETLLLIAQHKDRFSKLTYLLIPDYEKIEFTRNKKNIIQKAQELDIPCPKTWFIKYIEEVEEIAKEIGYPAVIKPQVSFGSYGIKWAKNKEELISKYREVHKIYFLPLIQESIPQEGEAFGVSALFNRDSELRAVFVHKRLREYPITGGPSTLRESVKNERIQELGLRLLKALNWVGVAMVEFKVDPRDGKPKLMEVNPRFWGSLQLAILSGVDFPYLIYRMAKEGDIEPVLDYKIGVRCRWMFPGDFLHFFSNLKRLRWTSDFFNFRTNYDILSLRDPGPTLGRILSVYSFLFQKEMRRLLCRR
ncbi:ATP-grasp domain-containing protein [bacterium]|nr:ATP-grasp domain-containing protein [bacterium]